jgi:hypothetical protein
MATKVNLIMDQGATFNSSFTVLDVDENPIDFTGYNAVSVMKKTYTSMTSYSFTVNAYSNGNINLFMTADDTLQIPAGRYVYDVDVTESNSGVKSRIAEGIITVTPAVTM